MLGYKVDCVDANARGGRALIYPQLKLSKATRKQCKSHCQKGTACTVCYSSQRRRTERSCGDKSNWLLSALTTNDENVRPRIGSISSARLCGFLDDPCREDPETIAELIEGRHSRNAGKSFWELHFPDSGGREEFIAIWLAMRYPPGSAPLKLALADAAQAPLRPQGPTSPVYRALVGIAYHLQKRAGNRDIVLPQIRIA
jgi:hypothetical protein